MYFCLVIPSSSTRVKRHDLTGLTFSWKSQKNKIKINMILLFRMPELSLRYLYKANLMYFMNIYSKAIIDNGIHGIAFPKESETRNLVMVNKILDIYFAMFPGAAVQDRCPS